MSSINNYKIISTASPHTIKKFELIEKYVESWAQKLLNSTKCNDLIFIDCMSNSGEYISSEDNAQVYGTPVRVAAILRKAAKQYPEKKIKVILNDYDKNKVDHLKKLIGDSCDNFLILYKTEEANELLKKIGPGLQKISGAHCLLVYDPYDASIDWEAVTPFINSWSEVIINHMVSDPIRALGVIKKDEKKKKYEKTYKSPFEELIPYGTDKIAYEKRVHQIIKEIRKSEKRKYYISSYPFFIRTNNIEYNLIHCTSHIKGFNLYKTTAWQVFGGHSSDKNLHGKENQFVLEGFNDNEMLSTATDTDCYTLHNVAEYLQKTFEGQQNVPLVKVWKELEVHPIFPSDGFRKEIKNILVESYGATLNKSEISFKGRS